MDAPGATWADFERLLEIRGQNGAPRYHYLDGTIEIMSPSPSHETVKGVIGCLLEGWCLEHDVDFTTVGSWTLRDEPQEAGAEPDECYVFGTREPEEGARPDLAIEVICSSWAGFWSPAPPAQPSVPIAARFGARRPDRHGPGHWRLSASGS